MTMLLTIAAPPLAALVTGFFLVAIPSLILMVAWTCVTMVRILFPERDLPFDGTVRREAARQKGRAVGVRFRDLVEDQRHAKAPAMPHGEASRPPEVASPLMDDLWLRRN